MGKHLVMDVVELADQGKTREQIAAELGITVKQVGQKLSYAKRSGRVFQMPPRAVRTQADSVIPVQGEQS